MEGLKAEGVVAAVEELEAEGVVAAVEELEAEVVATPVAVEEEDETAMELEMLHSSAMFRFGKDTVAYVRRT